MSHQEDEAGAALLRKARLEALKKISDDATSGLRQSLLDLKEQRVEAASLISSSGLNEVLRKEAESLQKFSAQSAKALAEHHAGSMRLIQREAQEKELAQQAQRAVIDQLEYLEKITEQNISIVQALSELSAITNLYEKQKELSGIEQQKMAKRTEVAAWTSVGLAIVGIFITVMQVFFTKPPIVNVESPKASVVNVPPVDFEPLIKELKDFSRIKRGKGP